MKSEVWSRQEESCQQYTYGYDEETIFKTEQNIFQNLMIQI